MSDKPKFSWNQLVLFTRYAEHYINSKKGAETKFTYALRRVLPQIVAHEPKLQEALADIDIENCVTEKCNGSDGVIARDDKGNLVFTVAGAKLRNKQKTEHLTKPGYEIEPYFAHSELPAELTVDQVLAFSGLVFSPDKLNEILTMLEDAAADDTAQANGQTILSQ